MFIFLWFALLFDYFLFANPPRMAPATRAKNARIAETYVRQTILTTFFTTKNEIGFVLFEIRFGKI